MPVTRPFGELGRGLAALLGDGGRFWSLLTAAVLLQATFWYAATPGPTLLGARPRTLAGAATDVAVSAVLLLAVPLLLGRAAGFRRAEEGLRLGDARFGLAVTAAVWVVVLPVLYLAGAAADIRAAYPWPGSWPGRSAATFLAWAAIYLAYYVAFEFFHRGFLLRLVSERWGEAAGIWLSALLATLVHVGKPPLEVAAALPAGLVLGVLAVRSRSLLYPVLLHWLIGLTTDAAALHHQGLLFRG